MGPAAAGVPGAVDLHRLFHVGGVSSALPRDRRLLVSYERRELSFTFLFAGDFRELAAQLVWIPTRLVAVVASRILPGVSHSLGAGGLSVHLLFLFPPSPIPDSCCDADLAPDVKGLKRNEPRVSSRPLHMVCVAALATTYSVHGRSTFAYAESVRPRMAPTIAQGARAQDRSRSQRPFRPPRALGRGTTSSV